MNDETKFYMSPITGQKIPVYELPANLDFTVARGQSEFVDGKPLYGTNERLIHDWSAK